MGRTTQRYIEEWRNQWGSSETYGRRSPLPGVVSWARANHQEKPYFIKVLPKTSSNEINATVPSVMVSALLHFVNLTNVISYVDLSDNHLDSNSCAEFGPEINYIRMSFTKK